MKNIKLKTTITLMMLCCHPLVQAGTSQVIEHAVASKERPDNEVQRDKHRKPAEVLTLLGVKAGMKVADFSSGGGYYTDILSRIVGEQGMIVAHNTPYVINRFAQFLDDPKQGWLSRLNSPQWRKNVVKNVQELDTIELPLQLDAALMVLFYHDTVWQGVNRDMMNRRIFNALKPGGAYLIIDHNAKEGSKLNDVSTFHRIDKKHVIDEISKVGFVLDTDSTLLSNPDDKRDYNFTRDATSKRDQTDRMVLKFIKPFK